MFCRSVFVLFPSTIVLFVLLRLGIFKHCVPSHNKQSRTVRLSVVDTGALSMGYLISQMIIPELKLDSAPFTVRTEHYSNDLEHYTELVLVVPCGVVRTGM